MKCFLIHQTVVCHTHFVCTAIACALYPTFYFCPNDGSMLFSIRDRGMENGGSIPSDNTSPIYIDMYILLCVIYIATPPSCK